LFYQSFSGFTRSMDIVGPCYLQWPDVQTAIASGTTPRGVLFELFSQPAIGHRGGFDFKVAAARLCGHPSIALFRNETVPPFSQFHTSKSP
jgi:hypothetical protein